VFEHLGAGGCEELFPVHLAQTLEGGDLARLQGLNVGLRVGQAHADFIPIGAAGPEGFAGEDDVLAIVENLNRPHHEGESAIVDLGVHLLGKGRGDLVDVGAITYWERLPDDLRMVIEELLGDDDDGAVRGFREGHARRGGVGMLGKAENQ